MKRRLTHNGKRVYIKSLNTSYALVSYKPKGFVKVFMMPLLELVKIK